jgi:hypothetical protein
MKNLIGVVSIVFAASSLLISNSALGQSLEKCLKSTYGDSAECDSYRSNGGISKDNKFYGLQVSEINSYRLELVLAPSNKKDDVIKGVRKLCGNMVLKQSPGSELWYLETPNTQENPAKACAPSCGARNIPSNGTYQVRVSRWSGECKK